MPAEKLLLVVDEALDTHAVTRRAEDVLSHWQGTDRPVVEAVPGSDLIDNASLLNQAGMVWLVYESDASNDVFEITGVLQERRIPSVLSLPQGESVATSYEDGVACCSLNVSDTTICSALRSVWSQTPLIAEMRREIKLLRAQEGGLCGQIAQLDEELRMAAQLQKRVHAHGIARGRRGSL